MWISSADRPRRRAIRGTVLLSLARADDSANESRSLAAINENVHWVYTDGGVLLTSPLTTTARATYDDPRRLSTLSSLLLVMLVPSPAGGSLRRFPGARRGRGHEP